ncbi:hypothetical protein LY76DRAFT_589993 [Colletotrichum caudatum]|nr:hypothetical protein LY76DRAFT_589993 [Colletotrichum caudatum]
MPASPPLRRGILWRFWSLSLCVSDAVPRSLGVLDDEICFVFCRSATHEQIHCRNR